MVYRYYNLTNLTSAGNQTTLLTFVGEVNNQLNYVPGVLVLVSIYIILFLSLTGRGVDPFRSFAASSWVAMILAIILYPMSLIPGTVLVIFCILAPISLVILFMLGARAG
jgi:hypothetical protein